MTLPPGSVFNWNETKGSRRLFDAPRFPGRANKPGRVLRKALDRKPLDDAHGRTHPGDEVRQVDAGRNPVFPQTNTSGAL
jgi:hypothetical protein